MDIKIEEYNEINNIINNYVKDPISSYDKLHKIASSINSGEKAYRALTRSNNQRIIEPTKESINSFFERFPKEKYGYRSTNKSFLHVQSFDFQNNKMSKKLYLSFKDQNNTLKFAKLFADRCEKQKIPFYFKVNYMEPNGTYTTSNHLRDESIVIYSTDENILDYLNICIEIKNISNLNNAISPPPILTGTIDDFIGYGEDPIQVPGKLNDSYNGIRAKLIEKAVFYANNNLYKKYGQNSSKILEDNIKNVGYTQEYMQYLTDIKNYIINHASEYNIDSQHFFSNKQKNTSR